MKSEGNGFFEVRTDEAVSHGGFVDTGPREFASAGQEGEREWTIRTELTRNHSRTPLDGGFVLLLNREQTERSHHQVTVPLRKL